VPRERVDTFSFFERIQRYLRSIGYYGDSPMLTCVYGSSEYAQAFSRTGSIFGNVYIVNNEVEIGECCFAPDPANDRKQRFDSIKISYNSTPLKPRKGIFVGSDYQEWFLKQANAHSASDESSLSMVRCVRMTVLSRMPLIEDLTEKVATFVFPPGTFKVGDNGGYVNRHPIRVFQFNSSTMSCPRNMFLIMAIMQLDCDVPQEVAKSPLFDFIEKIFPGLTRSASFPSSALEIFAERECDTAERVSGEPPQMKTEAELVEAEKAKPVKENPCPHVHFAVVYSQDSLQNSQSSLIAERFSNVWGFADADFDMDLDVNFHESESLFFSHLGYVKRDDDSEHSDQHASEEESKVDEQEKGSEERDDGEKKRRPGCETKKPVAFLERPAEVLKAYRQFENHSNESDDENKIIDGLFDDLKDKSAVKQPDQNDSAQSAPEDS